MKSPDKKLEILSDEELAESLKSTRLRLGEQQAELARRRSSSGLLDLSSMEITAESPDHQ